MSYVVLARRYRPQTLDQVIGQDHISRTLKNAITENRVAHAYLFSGPRGVGKTTTARILAKALNCKSSPTTEPCGKCTNCQEITAGSSVDVQEIDGASNRGIDEIRALRDNVKFAPASSKYKIYIIDEAHQITDAAFNALLKTLEEPPAHVVFILATTESQKIPVTILSRCQRYRFRFLSAKEISSTLEKIVKNDGFEIDPAALQMITNASGGSMRDALSLMDQAISFVSGAITPGDVQELLGFLPREIICAMTEAISREDNAKILAIINEVTGQGYNLLQFARDLRDHLRHILLYKVNPGLLETTADELKLLEAQHSFFTPAALIRSGHLISKALDEMRWNDQPRLVLELYLLKLAQPYAGITELVDRLEKIEKNIPFETAASQSPLPMSFSEPQASTGPAPAARIEEPAAALPAAAEEAPKPVLPAVDKDASIIWDEVVAELQRTRPLVGSVISDAVLQGHAGANILIGVRNSFQMEGFKRNQALIEEMIEKKAGRRYSVKLSIETGPAAPARVEKEVIVVPEEERPPMPTGEVFQVDGELTELKNSIPPGMEKIAGKFPGRITKKK